MDFPYGFRKALVDMLLKDHLWMFFRGMAPCFCAQIIANSLFQICFDLKNSRYFDRREPQKFLTYE